MKREIEKKVYFDIFFVGCGDMRQRFIYIHIHIYMIATFITRINNQRKHFIVYLHILLLFFFFTN